jgi:DNA polymerase
MDISQINKRIKKCSMCEGLNSQALGTLNAPGYGDIKSNVVFIGQSLCGNPCIKAQIPFTGGSGKLLDQAFSQTSIVKNQIYITNVVKCHPPKNRKSKKQEISNCSPYLDQELKLIKPKVIICLGKDAWAYLKIPITKPCNKTVLVNGKNTTIHFVYHPSYIMRQKKPIRQQYINSLASVVKSGNA